MFEDPKYQQLTEEFEAKFTEAFDYVIVSCDKYLDIVSSTETQQQTQLDKERKIFCRKEMVHNVCHTFNNNNIVIIL